MTFSHTVWAEQVSSKADLHEERLQARLTSIIVNTIEHPSASIPQASGSAGQAKATLCLGWPDRSRDVSPYFLGHPDRIGPKSVVTM